MERRRNLGLAAAAAAMLTSICLAGCIEVWADVNLDGYVDSLDVALAAACVIDPTDPRCVLADSDHDGDVDAEDVAAVARWPRLILFDRRERLVATSAQVGSDGVIYVFDRYRDRIFRWSLAEDRQWKPIVLGTDAEQVVFSRAHGRIYVAYLDGTIEAIDPRRPDLRMPFASVDGVPRILADAGEWLYVRATDTQNRNGRHTTFAADGSMGDSRATDAAGAAAAWNAADHHVYLLSSSKGLLRRERIDPLTGSIDPAADLASAPPFRSPLRISLDGSRGFLGGGDVVDLASMTPRSAIPIDAADGLWLDDGRLLTLRTHPTKSNSTRLEQWSADLHLESRVDLAGRPVALLQHEARIVAVTQGIVPMTQAADRPLLHDYVPDDDRDADGVPFAADAFPDDRAASLDSDADGFPDAWNEGSSASDSSLVLDAFPLDAACQTPEHAVAGDPSRCDIEGQIPYHDPIWIVADAEGVIYMMGGSGARPIYRWSMLTGEHLNPIPLELGENWPNAMAFSAATKRLVVGYPSGEITQVRLPADLPREERFTATRGWVHELVAMGPDLLSIQSWDGEHVVLNTDGEVRSVGGAVFHRPTWSDARQRIYYTNSEDLYSHRYDPATGILGKLESNPHSSFDLRKTGVARVDPTGTRLVVGSRTLYDAQSLELVGWLPMPIQDALWCHDGSLFTIRADGRERTILEHWDPELRLVERIELDGAPGALVTSVGLVAVVTYLGMPSFTVFEPDSDADGDGVPLGLDDFPRDPAASLDTDGDGAPEAWNPGRGPADSTQGLALDVFPDEPACQRPEHSVGGICDYRLVIPDDPDAPACSEDFLPATATSGFLEVPGSSGGWIPLCSGWGLLSEMRLPEGWRVALYNVVDGRRGDVFLLPEEPRYLAYDPAHHVAYVTVEWIEAVGRIDLRSGEVELIQVDFRPWGLTLDPEGNLFISHDSWFYYRSADGTLSRELYGLEGNHNVWDPFSESLISGGTFEVRRFAFDPVQGRLSHLDWLETNDIYDLALSPDGAHVAFAQLHATGVPDVSAAEFQEEIGYWDTVVRPYAVAFDPTSTLLAAGTATGIQLFDVGTHERLATMPEPAADCTSSEVAFSRGGRLVTGRQHCGYPNTRTTLVWRVVR